MEKDKKASTNKSKHKKKNKVMPWLNEYLKYSDKAWKKISDVGSNAPAFGFPIHKNWF